MNQQTNQPGEPYSAQVIAALRALAPSRPATFGEALRVAKLQATRLLHLLGVEDGPVPVEFIDFMPQIRVIKADLPVSGISHWSGSQWVITVTIRDSWRRQRATVAHEFKHIIDHHHAELLYPGDRFHDSAHQAEIAATYFAGCVLVPRTLLKQA